MFSKHLLGQAPPSSVKQTSDYPVHSDKHSTEARKCLRAPSQQKSLPARAPHTSPDGDHPASLCPSITNDSELTSLQEAPFISRELWQC